MTARRSLDQLRHDLKEGSGPPVFGVCWYPEQWSRDRWPVDVQQMVDLGLEMVRIGEFAWSWYEPRGGEFHWEGLDQAVALCTDAGLGVVLGTPTATPPVWLVRERPEMLSVGPDGRRRAPGSRRHTCPTAPACREEAARIVTALGERYGNHPGVVAWQVDNEPGNHDSARCWCDACAQAFRVWVADRYGTIEALNAAWGTAFWSGTYASFDEVTLPVPTMTAQNPALELAHWRFASDQVVAGLAEQVAVLAGLSPGRPTATNLYVDDRAVDAVEVARVHDVAAIDSYPHGVAGPEVVAALLDRARGQSLAPGATGDRAWVMEQQPGRINWTPANPEVPPGQVRLWGWQALLHGVQVLLFFRWRAARAGQEQYHTGLLRHDGSRDLGFHEVRRLITEVRTADPQLFARPPATVALVHAFDDVFTVDLEPHAQGWQHLDLVAAAHEAAARLGLEVDVVPPDVDLTGYALVLAPALHLAVGDRVDRLRAAADAGALVVLGPRSLVRDVDGVWVDQPVPAGLTGVLGAWVDDAGSTAVWPAWGRSVENPSAGVRSAPRLRVVGADAPKEADRWAETLVVTHDDVDVLATYLAGWRSGRVAAVRRGNWAYVGTDAHDVWTAILSHLTGRPVGPVGLEAFVRGGTRVTLDHADLSVQITRSPGGGDEG